MQLTSMSEADYNYWAPRCLQSYAEGKMKANNLTQREADEAATADFKRILPDGPHSKGNFLFTAKDDAQNSLGFAWFCIRGPEGNKKAFICDVIIEEKYRGKGFGKQIMLLVEKEVQRLGLSKIGLHVFGFNEAAIKLYQSLGYLTTDLEMEKSL